MKLLILLVLLTTGVYAQRSSTDRLLPQPVSLSSKPANASFHLTQNTKVRVESDSKELKDYAARLIYRLQYKTGVFFDTHKVQDTTTTHEIVIKALATVDSLNLTQDESYTIDVEAHKTIIEAPTNIGAYRGIETLLQLATQHKGGGTIHGIKINDNPRFQWRGLLIDVCRHWVPKHIILRNIDAMAAVKMNVLHLHLTEDQGFRIESKKFPKLHEQGSNGNYFTQVEIKDIIQYAKARGIRVIPEFDIPGHISSWLVGYPELGSAERDYEVATRYGVFKASLNPTEENTYLFLDTFLTEMCQLFPDAYFHIGGDENNGKDWDANKKIQKFMVKNELKDNHALQAYFNRRILEIVTRNGKKMVGWDEIYNDGIPNSIVIQSWRGKQSMVSSAQNGYPSLLSRGFYLDKSQRLEHYYSTDPLPKNTVLTTEQQKLILGGEACMWSEIVDQNTIDSRIWPSTLAVAERLWSTQANCDLSKFYKKVSYVSKDLQLLGLTHLSYQNVLLGQMTGIRSFEPLKPLVNVLEPVKGYKRHNFIRNTNKYSTVAPLNRLVDACYVESFEARNFNSFVKNKCKNGGFCTSKEEIKSYLAKWTKASEYYTQIATSSQALMENHQFVINIQELCELAWRKVNSPSELTETENTRAKTLINNIETFKTDVVFAPIEGIKIIFGI